MDATLFLQSFRCTAELHLRPFPGKNSILTLDRAGVHTSVADELEAICREIGCLIHWCTPYSPDIHAIEGGFYHAQRLMKNESLRHLCRTDPRAALIQSLDGVTPALARACFAKCSHADPRD